MDKLGDIELFINIVKHKGLAAAGREQGLSPASVTARLNRLEKNYGVRLLNRTTRSVTLTEEGRRFFNSCVRILADMKQAEEWLTTGQSALAGRLKITATIDLGRNEIAPLLKDFVQQYPDVSVHLTLIDERVNLVEGGYDLAIRYGSMQDSSLIARKLASSKRMLCASPEYLKKHGHPKKPEDLKNHYCVAMEQEEKYLQRWYFVRDGVKSSHVIDMVMSSNDGGQVRQWALDGLGIAIKSYWDIRADLKSGRLVELLEDYNSGYTPRTDNSNVDLYAVYISREFLPERTRIFINLLLEHFETLSKK